MITLKVLESIVVNYFGNDSWLFIKQPRLDYTSPYTWLKNNQSIETIVDLLNKDISLNS